MTKYIEISVDGQIGRIRLEIGVDEFIDNFVKNLLGKFRDITPEEYESGKTMRTSVEYTPQEGNPFLMELYVL